MSQFRWEKVDPGPGEAVAPHQRLSWGKTAGLGAQHVVAMFGATFVFPLIMGLNANLAIMMSGIATICFLLIVKGKVPSYLGTSASFVAAATAIYSYQGGDGPGGPADVTGAILVAGVVLALVGLVIHLLGPGSVNAVLPPVVTGAVVMLIGFNLAPVATKTYMPSDPWIAIITMTAVILMAVGLRGFFGRIAIFLGLIFGYVISLLADIVFGQTSLPLPGNLEPGAHDRVNWDAVKAADWFGFPVHTTDGLVGNQAFTPGYAEVGWHTPSFSVAFILLALPAVIALVAENLGHVKAVGEMTKTDLDPYLGRAVGADGVGTVIASAVGGSPTTTYAENIGVMAATRVYSTAAYYVAAVAAILLGLVPKFGQIVNATPPAVLGGITLVLYGMIGLLGAKIWKENGVDFAKPINLVPISAGIILAIGEGSLKITDDFYLSGIALGTIVVVAGYHLARLVGRDDDDGAVLAVGHPGAHTRVKPAPFAYVRPDSLGAALVALAADPDAKVLAGGQSLVPLLSMRLAAPSTIVDINGVPGLSSITVTDEGVRVGALARHADVLADEGVRRVQPLVCLALAHVAHATIRNRGTTVGSIVHADTAAEMPVVLTLLGGSVEVVGSQGTRTIPADELFVGPLETSLTHDEIATSAFFPALAPGARVAFDEIARRHGDYAMAGVAVLVEGPVDARTVRAGFVSVGDVPAVVDLSGVPLDEVGDAALAHLDPLEDIHATAAYRAQLVRVLTERVVRRAMSDG